MTRLLSVNTYYYRRGGSDVAFLEHDRLFAGLGWETAVFAMRHPRNEASAWSRYFADEIEFGHHYSWPRRVSMSARVVYSVEARRKLGHLVDAWRPDVAHAHCVYHHLSPSVLGLLKSRGIPIVMTAHDLKLACPAYKMFNGTGVCERCRNGNLLHLVRHRCIHDSAALSSLIMIESAVHRTFGLYSRNVDRIVVPSRFYGDKLVEWGWPREKLVHIPNFIEAEQFEPSYAPGDYFLYFGRLAPEKGVASLVRAAALTGARVKIVGTGPSEAALRALAASDANVEFLGYRAGADLWSLVRGCRAVVLPSQWYENAPISILEAYACGKPVLGSAIGGIVEMIREDETGCLFDAHSGDALAGVLDRLQTMGDGAVARMGHAARNLVTTQYTKDRYVRGTLAVYSALGAAAAEPLS